MSKHKADRLALEAVADAERTLQSLTQTYLANGDRKAADATWSDVVWIERQADLAGIGTR